MKMLENKPNKDGNYMYNIVKELSQYNRLAGTNGNHVAFEKILEILNDNGHNPKVQEFVCSDAPINIFFRLNGLILAVLYTFTWIALYIQNALFVFIFSIFLFCMALMGEKISSASFGRFKKIGRSINCKNATWTIDPTEEQRYVVIFVAHHDSKSQRFRVKIRAAIMIATTLTMIIYSIQTIINGIKLLVGPQDPILPSIFSMIWTYFICLIILFNSYGNKSPGANDNLSAVAVVIQLANYYRKNPLKHTQIQFLINDAEEMGLYGAQEWYNQMESKINRDQTFFIIFDTVGALPLINLSSFGIPPHVISKKFQSIIKEAQAKYDINDLKKLYLPIGAATDHVIFDRHGYNCLVITSLCGRIHTKKDSIDYIEGAALIQAKKIGDAIIKVIESGFLDVH